MDWMIWELYPTLTMLWFRWSRNRNYPLLQTVRAEIWSIIPCSKCSLWLGVNKKTLHVKLQENQRLFRGVEGQTGITILEKISYLKNQRSVVLCINCKKKNRNISLEYWGGSETLQQMPCINGLLFVKEKCTFLAAN